MYLSSTDIRKLIEENYLVIKSSENFKFDPDLQIGPCSVDIRISNEFWKFKGCQAIDILSAYDIEKVSRDPNHLYEKIVLEAGQGIDVEPRQVLLTHALEYLEMPEFLAGMITGRSRFSRLGLSVHCTGSFINPGYKGYLPLQLTNNNPSSVRIYPFLDLVQLVFILTSSIPDVNYQELNRTLFKVDEGGPSLWFMDSGVRSLAYSLSQEKFPERVEVLIKKELQKSQQDILDQLENYLMGLNLPSSQFQKNDLQLEQKTADELERKMQAFETVDSKRKRKIRITSYFNSIFFGANLSVLIPSLVSVIQNKDVNDPLFLASLLFFIFSLIIMWLTFEPKYI